MRAERGIASALAVLLAAPMPGATRDAAPAVSAATTPAEAGLVSLRTRSDDVDLDVRYHGHDNFTGAPVDGYEAAECYLLAPVADALARVERGLRAQGLRLRVFDCYRPVRAVRRFVAWVHDTGDARSKAAYYPNLDKADLLGDYIAEHSGHSRGASVDLTLLQCTPDGHCTELDMGTPFDFFDPRANLAARGLSAAQQTNRDRLQTAMRAGGFAPYAFEWWHFSLPLDPAPTLAHDVVIR